MDGFIQSQPPLVRTEPTTITEASSLPWKAPVRRDDWWRSQMQALPVSRRLALRLVRLGLGQVQMSRCEWREGPA